MATVKKIQNATLENVRIGFRNFAGKEGRFNALGNRNFVVFLDADTADAMREDGWNIKQLQPREEGDSPQDYLTVKVNYKGRPPRVVVITSKGQTALDESLVEVLDWADILTADVIIRPYSYDVNGRQGVSAYLQSLYVTIQEDYLEQKYSHIPDTNARSLAIESDIEDAEVVEEDYLEIES